MVYSLQGLAFKHANYKARLVAVQTALIRKVSVISQDELHHKKTSGSLGFPFRSDINHSHRRRLEA